MSTRTFRKLFFEMLICFSGLFFLALALWTNKYFGKVTIDQAISTILFNVNGTMDADSIFITRFIEWCIIWPGVITLAIFSFKVCSKTKYFQSLAMHLGRAMRIATSHMNTIILASGVFASGYQYSAFSYFKDLFHHHQDFFAEKYVDPHQVKFVAKKPKSLVLIYVESLEDTYSNSDVFRHDLLRQLTELNVNKISFKNYHQVYGTGWTIAGIIGTQCAIPLKVSLMFDGNRVGENIKHYLPGATCLSDILAESGYKNVFMKGASLRFSGVGTFLEDHHYHEMIGRAEWLKMGIPEAEFDGWGLPDDILFEQAKIKLGTLMKSSQPFNLTILTVDTHGSTGLLNKTCLKKGYNDFQGIVECSANQLAEFVTYIKSHGWLEKVNVVILGDHLAMKNAVSDKLEAAPSRSIYNLIVTKSTLHKNRENIIHFDLLPTILDSLGFHYAGRKLGLGCSAIEISREGADAKCHGEIDNASLSRDSKTYNRFWVASDQSSSS